MPTVAIVDGVKIQIFFADHAPPHFHVDFGGYQAQIVIKTLEIIEGEFPSAKLRKVREWARPRRKALLAAWALASVRRNPGKVS
ncbi:MAG: DUF4160 domain-containing protein [Bauldia sp.]